ncbi:MAG: DUF2652 domain-containing protein [Ignavibacteriaceae bacterium]
MNTQSTLYIPDISGFTKFVTDTEIDHGQNITAALLEEIIKSNYLDFIVSEIEGDSVLFYRSNDNLNFEELMELSLHIFRKFHEKRIELDSSTKCNCGACSSITKLTLKFIVHLGEVRSSKISNFVKLYGKDVILVHRLLKNNIKENQYILFTNAHGFDITSSKVFLAFDEPKIFVQDLEDIGLVKGVYFTFNSTRDNNSENSTHIH